MKGSVMRRGKRWLARIDLPHHEEGERRRQKTGTFATTSEAEEWLARVSVEQGSGFVDPDRRAVGLFLDQWMDAMGPNLKPNTAASYTVASQRWRPVIGSVLVTKLTPLLIQRGASGFAGRLAPVTARYTYQVLRTALRQGVKWGSLARNPASGIKVASGKRELGCWDEGEARGFFRSVDGRTHDSALFRLALATGMRLGELLGLRWEDVDLEKGTVQVRHSLSWPRRGRPELLAPKTAASRRTIPVDRGTVEVLRQHRRRQAAGRLAVGPAWRNLNLVLCTRQGGYVDQKIIQCLMAKLAERAGVPTMRFHDMRQTHATLLLRQARRSVKEVSERLGHANVTVTLQTYAPVLADQQVEMAHVIGEVLDAGRDQM